MLAPNAMQIEAAVDSLQKKRDTMAEYPTLTDFIYNAQLKELHTAMGTATMDKLYEAFLIPSFEVGFMLGLQTARIVLMTSSALAIGDIKAESIL
jgi:hypothetical protein